MVDQTKLKLQGMVSIRWHLQLGIQECVRRRRKTMGGRNRSKQSGQRPGIYRSRIEESSFIEMIKGRR